MIQVSIFFGKTYKKNFNRIGVGILLFLCLFHCNKIYGQEKGKMNILFIISDDLTATALSSYGNPISKTPNIDKLAAEGTKFMNTYCQFPICGPSRASMMFSFYPSATKTYGYVSGRENVGDGHESWAEFFRNRGYYTARVGKIFHMGSVDIMLGRDGQDDPDSWTEKFNPSAPEVHSKGEGELVQNNPFGLLSILAEEGQNGGNLMNIVKADESEEFYDVQVADKVIELLRKHKDSSFFISAGFFRPHVPFVAPMKYFDLYPYKQMVLPPKVNKDWDLRPDASINYVTTRNSAMSEEQEKKAIAAYYACTSFLDDQVGRILKALKEEALEENTIVIFTSDHGYLLGEHDFWMKVSLLEESSRVPLIIKVPGKAPAVVNSINELIDLYPTVVELAGFEPPDYIQGMSFSELFDNPDNKFKDFAFTITIQPGHETIGYLIRTSEWAFIQYGKHAEEGIELYNMEVDPKQYNNLADNPYFAFIVNEFKHVLQEKLTKTRKNALEIEYED